MWRAHSPRTTIFIWFASWGGRRRAFSRLACIVQYPILSTPGRRGEVRAARVRVPCAESSEIKQQHSLWRCRETGDSHTRSSQAEWFTC